jgi:hypothetical protein
MKRFIPLEKVVDVDVCGRYDIINKIKKETIACLYKVTFTVIQNNKESDNLAKQGYLSCSVQVYIVAVVIWKFTLSTARGAATACSTTAARGAAGRWLAITTAASLWSG